MEQFTDEEYVIALSAGTAVCLDRVPGRPVEERGEKALWLTAIEAECLLVLCAASPVSAGPCEHSLFTKLSKYYRSHAT